MAGHDAVAGLAACAVIVAGAQTGASTGTIAGALAAIGLVLTPLRDLASVWNFRAAYLAARKKCNAALSRAPRGTGQGDTRLPTGPLRVTVRDLPMPQGNTLSLDIAAGETHALTCTPDEADTLFSALCGLEPVPPGHISLSGHGLTDLSRGSLRRGVHRLSSAPVVLKGSLRRNLSPADRSALSFARILLGKPQLVLLEDGVWHLDLDASATPAEHLDKAVGTILRHPNLRRADLARPRAA